MKALTLLVSMSGSCLMLRAIPATAPPRMVPAENLKDLPLVEISAQGRRLTPEDEHDLVILLTGDGGWAALYCGLAMAFKEQGLSTVALNSLRHFWNPRTPEQVALDLSRLISHYLRAWRKTRAILVGYSFGADVLPFALARLPPELRSRIATANLLGMSSTAVFEIKVLHWIRGGSRALPVAPELHSQNCTFYACMAAEMTPLYQS